MLCNIVYPVIILVEPQLAVNVGMIARTMLNFNFSQLRIVKPRDSEVINQAIAASCGAENILKECKVFENLSAAVRDLQIVYATTNRSRYMHKTVTLLADVFCNIDFTKNNFTSESVKLGFLFGKESRGLDNNSLNYANMLVKIDTNPEFSSLNIVQAVALVCYEWHTCVTNNNKQNSSIVAKSKTNLKKFVSELATFEDTEYFFKYIENCLENKNFYPLDKKESMIRNFRNIFLRNQLTKSEIKTLFRIIKALINSK